MKIILLSIGTRGDMEPFLSLSDLLLEKGHQVICAFPEQFRNLAEDSNMEFASLGSKFIEMPPRYRMIGKGLSLFFPIITDPSFVEFPNATQVSHDWEKELKQEIKGRRKERENDTELFILLDFISRLS